MTVTCTATPSQAAPPAARDRAGLFQGVHPLPLPLHVGKALSSITPQKCIWGQAVGNERAGSPKRASFKRHSMKSDVLIRVSCISVSSPGHQDTPPRFHSLPALSVPSFQPQDIPREQEDLGAAPGFSWIPSEFLLHSFPPPPIPPYGSGWGTRGNPSCPGVTSLPQLQYSIFLHSRKTGKRSRPLPAGRHFLLTSTKCSTIKITRSANTTRNMGTGCPEKLWRTEGGFRMGRNPSLGGQ